MTITRRVDRSRPFVARRMNAVEQLRAEKKPWRLTQLVLGLAGYGISLTLLVESSLGASSWNILAEGVALHSGLTFGLATNIIALVVLVFWIPLRELPGLGTLLNVVLVGACADLSAFVLPSPGSLPGQLLYYVLGLLMLTWFDAVYLGARFGPGPRDGLMTGAVRVFGKPIWMVRTGIEVIVLIVGWLLGGTVGLGTVLIAVLMGPLVQQFLRVTTVRLAADEHAPESPESGEKPLGGRPRARS
ncbi:membrane protein YczE [Nocardia sp. NBC_00416]|uniref:membrane protein YczE n=1 Tax=Nocardia sp. NBC_00416 TaxID=2975991 RepID=UPI002E21BED8